MGSQAERNLLHSGVPVAEKPHQTSGHRQLAECVQTEGMSAQPCTFWWSMPLCGSPAAQAHHSECLGTRLCCLKCWVGQVKLLGDLPSVGEHIAVKSRLCFSPDLCQAPTPVVDFCWLLFSSSLLIAEGMVVFQPSLIHFCKLCGFCPR